MLRTGVGKVSKCKRHTKFGSLAANASADYPVSVSNKSVLSHFYNDSPYKWMLPNEQSIDFSCWSVRHADLHAESGYESEVTAPLLKTWRENCTSSLLCQGYKMCNLLPESCFKMLFSSNFQFSSLLYTHAYAVSKCSS